MTEALWPFLAGLGLGVTVGLGVALVTQFGAYRDLRKHLDRGRTP